jgi:hypothetical protein
MTTDLGTFDDRDVISTSIAITRAGDGLSASLAIEPRVLHVGDNVVVLDCIVSKIGFVPIKDSDDLDRVQTLRAGTALIIDRDVVHDALDAQQLKIEAAKGVQRIEFPDGGDEGD